ncbi:hypothetical protein F8C76_07700 [Flagellimonas olearia]|uniref:Uncharacterized protein n=1 Tax=Flagellimonas olearia TaxID=552546 RepID=A0A444VRA1_9FLAO|nr:hypothetical protein [Allomuricauda olearia]KAB7531367.1 hypothetical protein F8C76_07700 [Allomuricauda olearia]RYC53343.1 hypothetical protein DN53_03735 [Allomuricauda olearia]
MTTFFSLLLILLAINALLLIFSVNGGLDDLRKPIRKISEVSVRKLFPSESTESEYKKAV